MNLNLFSFFLNSERPFIEFNTNILETNVINIFLLFGLLFYANKVSLSGTLEDRQKEIIQTIENAQKDVLNASNYYSSAEEKFAQTLFALQSWKDLYEKEKAEIVNAKYENVKIGLTESFATTEKLIANYENKTFVALQTYLLLITTSKVLRKFSSLNDKEKAYIINRTVTKLGERKE